MVEIEIGGRRFRVEVRRHGERWRAVVDGRDVLLDARRVGARLSVLLATSDSEPPGGDARQQSLPGCAASHDVAVERQSRGRYLVYASGHVMAATVPRLVRPARAAGLGVPGGHATRITAPMPGRIVKVLVNAGDVVRARQPLVVVEAMKMENELRAPSDGIVVEVSAREGTLVEARAVLAVLAPLGTESERQVEES